MPPVWSASSADFEAQAVDDNGHPAASREAGGLLRFRAPWIPQGYLGNEAASNEALPRRLVLFGRC